MKKVIKKYKLYDFFGTKNLVSIQEYEKNIRNLLSKINKSNLVLLLDTIPNKELFRNIEIKKYNEILKKLSLEFDNCIYVELYVEFIDNFDKYYYDNTHINFIGYDFITEKIFTLIKKEKIK